MAVMEHYKKLLLALIELQITGNELFGQLLVDHNDANSDIPEKACAHVLWSQSGNFKNVPSFNYRCNEQKIYISKKPLVLKRKIDIQQLDTTFRCDLMLFLEGFPVSKPKNPNEKVKCTGACGKICKRKDFCCDRCKTCKECNERLPRPKQCAVYKLGVGLYKEKKLRNLFAHLTPKTLQNFLNGNGIFSDLPTVKDWKDLCEEFRTAMSNVCEYMSNRQNFSNPNVKIPAGNETVDRLSKLQLVLDGNLKIDSDENMKIDSDLNLVFNLKQILAEEKKQELMEIHQMLNDYITNRLDEMEDSMTDQHKQVVSKIELLKTEVLSSQDDIRNKIDLFNQKQDNMQALLGEIQKLVSSIHTPNVAAGTNQTTQEEEEKTWQDIGWRSIRGGVVIKLDDCHEEVESVLYTKAQSQLPTLKIKQKSRVPNVHKDPYFETDHSLLKIENMKNGTYQIHVKGKSGAIIKSLMVECNESNHPVHNIGKVGIAVPSSNVRKYFENIKTQLKVSTPEDHDISWVSKGASTTTKNLKEFEELGKQYLERNFLSDCEQTIRLSARCEIEDATVKRIVEQLCPLFERKYTCSSKRKVVLVSPNFAYHKAFIKNNICAMDNLRTEDEHCLSLFVEEESLIMVVRITSAPQEVESAITCCKEDIANIVESHGCKLKDENIRIVGVISCPSIKKEQLKSTLPYHFSNQNDFYKTLFLCKDDLENHRSLRKWWDATTSNLHKQFNMDTYNINHDFFSTIIGQHMASMASSQEGLPTLIGDSHEQLQTLILNRYQLRAIYSKSKIKLISAPFGAGKTVVGQKILKELSKDIQDSEELGALCYISCDPYSMVDASVQMSMSNIDHPKVTFLCGSLHDLYREHVNKDLTMVSLDILITKLTERCQNTHFIIDECNESVMTKEVATNINEHFNKADNISRITFIRQSIKKDRNYQHENQTHSLETDHFDMIQGLKTYELPKVVRLTVELQKVVDIAQKIITSKTVEVSLPAKTSKQSLSLKNLEPPPLPAVASQISGVDDIKEKHGTSLSTVSMTVNHPQYEEVQESSHASTNDIDLSLKLLSKTHRNANTGHSITTGFQCIAGEVGHDISHSKPEIIHFTSPISLSDVTEAKVLFHASNTCCFKHDDPVFIVTSIESAKIFYFMIKACNKEPLLHIPYLQQRIPSLKEKQDIVSKMRESLRVLITDHRSFLGMESKSITTFADPEESPNTFIEIASRCTTCLQIFVPYYVRSNESSTLDEILQALKEFSTIKHIRVDDKSTHNAVCVNRNENIIVSTKSEDFLSVDISDLYSRDEEFQVFPAEENARRFIELKVTPFQPINSPVTIERFIKLKGTPFQPINWPVTTKIIHHIEFEEKMFSFKGVFNVLYRKDFHLFERITRNDPNIVSNLRSNEFDSTLLMYAISRNEFHIIDYLMTRFDQQISWMAKNKSGYTVFHYAAQTNNIELMTILISKDRRGLDVCDNTGQTPLFDAARNHRRTSMVKLLLEHGADPHVKSNSGRTADKVTVLVEIKRMILNYQTKNAST